MATLADSSSSAPMTPSPLGHCVPSQTSSASDSSGSFNINLPDLVDVGIVGGGASGLAVAIQLISRVKNGYSMLKSIMIIEKRDTFGPGLAYSDDSAGLIVNTYADTMGLCPFSQMQFSEWVQKHSTASSHTPFPTRQLYGRYLGTLAQEVAEDAEELGVDFCVINGEVVDVQQFSDEPGFELIEPRFELTIDNGDSIFAKDVVLALGNFCATANLELRDNPNYFQCPWPIEKMQKIDTNADVLIIGSGLTAVDVANALMRHAHSASIKFVSRTGKLPKVQGNNEGHTFGKRYILSNLARKLELNSDRSGGALDALMSTMKSLIEEHDPESIPSLFKDSEPYETMRKDVEAARSGPTMWQLIIDATAPLIERYWNTFTLEEKELWFNKFDSTWATHRHSMPREIGQKMVKSLELGQLQVVQGSKVSWNESRQCFRLEEKDDKGRCIEGDCLIEAMGQEFDTAKIDSRLLKTLLASGLLKAHPVCGIDVDFDTLKAPTGIHVIGSLTNGVHFYVTNTDRITAHASRIADSLFKHPHRKPLHIAFFVGSDLFSHLMLSKLIPALLELGHFPFIFLPKDNGYHKPKNRREKPKVIPYELQHLDFWEKTMLQDTIIPTLGSTIPQGAEFRTIKQMASQHGILVQAVPNINDPAFLRTLKENHIDMGVSLRCYQRFKAGIIKYLNANGRCLLNLHPGKLPEYRGVIAAFRGLSNGDEEFGYSLHHIDEHFAAGGVIDIRTGKLDYGKNMLAGMSGLYEIGVAMIMDAVERFARGGDLHKGCVEQGSAKGACYKFPTQDELETASDNGIILVSEDGHEIRDLLVECFGGEDEEWKNCLEENIEEAFNKWALNTEKLLSC
ncbi:hypothetical protein N431DRAFT_433200 [Stipitochalara longipes BDJ]|nr:hypothetical protein N431DRAFT_433200 [Stipitochalara longipes BDJ]